MERKPREGGDELGRRKFLPGWFKWLRHGGIPRGQKANSGVRKPDSEILKDQTATQHFCIDLLATVEQMNTLRWEK